MKEKLRKERQIRGSKGEKGKGKLRKKGRERERENECKKVRT